MLLSIIVPVYNVEKYLHKCVDSLLAQDLSPEEYEIVLVDDGSTDHSGTICDEYGLDHSNVRVIHQQNGGLSAARNTGIEVAQGKYVQFVDSDDYLEPNVLKSLIDKMEQDNLDVLRFNYRNVNEQYEVFEPNKESKPFVDFRDEICDGLTFLTERLGFACYACQFVLKYELTRIRFTRGIYMEDTDWIPRLLLQTKRVTSVDTMVYNYMMRSGSITQSVDKKKKRKVLEDVLSLVDTMKTQMQDVSDQRWFEGMIAQIVVSAICNVSINFYEERKNFIEIIKAKKVFPLSYYHSSKTAKRKIKIANISPILLFWMIRIKNKY